MGAVAALQPARAKAPVPAAAPAVAAHEFEGSAADIGPTASLARIPVFAPTPPAPPPTAVTPAAPSIQRKCEACEAEGQEEQPKVQARLEVGAADDPFEREADTIAGSVMAMRDSDLGTQTLDASIAGPLVQRACSACSAAKDDKIKPRRLSAEEDDIDIPRMRTEQSHAGGESIAASVGQLTSGGSALPDATRTFFEARMGRDLSHVRLHTGAGAEALSRSIAARAFTYRNHIWLGRGEDTGPGFTMAHELAHVLQQTAPGLVGPDAAAQGDAATIRRAPGDETEPYFFPSGATHTALTVHTERHNAAQAALRTHKPNDGLLTEVPIPGADRTKLGIGEVYGNADLYFAGTKLSPLTKKPAIIGVQATNGGTSPNSLANFTNKDEPDTVTGPSGPVTVNKGPKISFAEVKDVTSVDDARAPKIDWAAGSLTDTGSMPTNIKLGEVKPAHSLKYRRSGIEQLKNYTAGIEAAAEATNRLYPGTNWVPNPRRMQGSELEIPKDWDPDKTHTSWPVKDIELKWTEEVQLDASKTKREPRSARPRKKVPKPDTIDGRWMISRGSRRKDGGDGLFVYYLHPKPADLRKALKNGNLTQGFERRLADVHQIPAKLRKPPTKATASKAKTKPLRIDPKPAAPKVQRKAMQDDFSAGKWEAFRRGDTKFPEESKNNVLDRLHEMAPAEILAQVNRNAGLAKWVKDNPDGATLPTDIVSEASGSQALTDYKFLQKASFWTGDTARLIGVLREKFGTIVVKGIDKFEAFKQKVSDKIEARKKKALERDKNKRGSIMMKAAKGVMAALLPLLIMPLVRQTFTLIMNCVESGFKAKLDKMFADDGPLADLKKMTDDLKGTVDTMSVEIEATIDTAIASVVGDYDTKVEEVIEDAKNVLEVIGMIKTIANGLRIGTCLVSLATAPETLGLGAVIGCGVAVADWILSQLGMSPIDYVIAKTIETCENKNLIGALMAKFAVVQQMPAKVASFSIKQIKAALTAFVPGTLMERPLGEHAAELLCDETKISGAPVPFEPIKCAAGGGSGGESVPDLPQDLVGKTFKDGDPITDAERKHMEGREGQVPAQTPPATQPPPTGTGQTSATQQGTTESGGEQATTGSGTGGQAEAGAGTGTPAVGARETRVETTDQNVRPGTKTPPEFRGWFVSGIGGSGFPSTYDSAEQGGVCFPKKVKLTFHDTYGMHKVPTTYDVEICKVYKHPKPSYEKNTNMVRFKFKATHAIRIIDKNTGELLVAYAVEAGKEYGAWMGARRQEVE